MRGPQGKLAQEKGPMDAEFRVLCLAATRKARRFTRDVMYFADSRDPVEVEFLSAMLGCESEAVESGIRALAGALEASEDGRGFLRTLVLGSTDSQTVRVGILIGRRGASYIRVGVGVVLEPEGWRVSEFAAQLVERR